MRLRWPSRKMFPVFFPFFLLLLPRSRVCRVGRSPVSSIQWPVSSAATLLCRVVTVLGSQEPRAAKNRHPTQKKKKRKRVAIVCVCMLCVCVCACECVCGYSKEKKKKKEVWATFPASSSSLEYKRQFKLFPPASHFLYPLGLFQSDRDFIQRRKLMVDLMYYPVQS